MAASKCLLLCSLLIMGTVVTPAFAARAHQLDHAKRGRELQQNVAGLDLAAITGMKNQVAAAGTMITPALGSLGVLGPVLLGIVNPLLAGVDQLLGGLLNALGAGPSVKVCPTCGVLNGLDLKGTLTPVLGQVNVLLGGTLNTVIGPNKVLTVAVNQLSNPSLLGNLVNGLLSGPLRAGANNINAPDPSDMDANSVNELTGAIEILKDVIGKVDGLLGGCGPLATLVNQLLQVVVGLLDGLLGGVLVSLVGNTLGPLLTNVLQTLGAGNCPLVG